MIWIPGSKVCVAFNAAADNQQGVLVSEGVKDHLRSMIGRVLAVGAQPEHGYGTSKESRRVRKCIEREGSPDYPAIGSEVLCKREDGTILVNPVGIDWEEVRFYGLFTPYKARPFRQEWWLSIMAEKVKGDWLATPENVLIRPDKAEERTASGLWLPPVAQRTPSYGTLVSVGEFVPDLEEGMRVCFNPHSTHPAQKLDEKEVSGLIPAHWSAVLYVLPDEGLEVRDHWTDPLHQAVEVNYSMGSLTQPLYMLEQEAYGAPMQVG